MLITLVTPVRHTGGIVFPHRATLTRRKTHSGSQGCRPAATRARCGCPPWLGSVGHLVRARSRRAAGSPGPRRPGWRSLPRRRWGPPESPKTTEPLRGGARQRREHIGREWRPLQDKQTNMYQMTQCINNNQVALYDIYISFCNTVIFYDCTASVVNIILNSSFRSVKIRYDNIELY